MGTKIFSKKDLNLFLQPTKYCDSNNQEIKQIARKIASLYKNKKEKVKALFYWVKDQIKFEFGHWGIKASETLRRKRGMCTNKANLLIALLRAIKIPAGYGILRVNTKKFYRRLMCPSFGKLASPETVHIYVGIFLNKKWLRCDPSADSEITEALKKKAPLIEMSDFDINKKNMKNINGILTKREFIPNIDKNLDKPAKHAKGMTLKILNSYVKFLREKGQDIRNLSGKRIEIFFLNWLRKKNINYFRFMEKLENYEII
ncbi:MAG: transglutaminase family protein [Patescibacteria group bacterium]|nr:transglutaminase family protein [Patescibacteria group bacterium]